MKEKRRKNLQGKDRKEIKNLALIKGIKPLINTYEPQGDLFKAKLDRTIDTKHGLAKLATTVDWERLEKLFRKTYCPDNGKGSGFTINHSPLTIN